MCTESNGRQGQNEEGSQNRQTYPNGRIISARGSQNKCCKSRADANQTWNEWKWWIYCNADEMWAGYCRTEGSVSEMTGVLVDGRSRQLNTTVAG